MGLDIVGDVTDVNSGTIGSRYTVDLAALLAPREDLGMSVVQDITNANIGAVSD